MIVAVTGGTGFIGSHLVDALIDRGDSVRVLSRTPVKLSKPNVTSYAVDFDHPESLVEALRGSEVVFHLAAALRAPHQPDLIEINRNTTRALLTAVREVVPTARIILCSSQAAAGPAINGKPRTVRDAANPISWYGKSKRAAEIEFENEKSINWTILRPPAVFGPRERDIFVFFKALARGWSVQIGSKPRRFSWIFVRDFVDALLLSISNQSITHQIHFVTSGATDWTEFRREAGTSIGRTYWLITLPKWVVQGVAIGGDGWTKITGRAALLNRDKISELSYPDWRCDDSDFRKLTGYQPTYNLSNAIAETIAWYRMVQWL